MGFYYTPNKVN